MNMLLFKIIFVTALILLVLPPIHGEENVPYNASLQINLQEPYVGGTIRVLAFDTAEGFEDFKAPVLSEDFLAEGQTALTLQKVQPGEYAILVYHDENDNGQLDLNFIGIPREPIGFSNQYQPKGPPTFGKAVFAYTPGTTEPVDMKLSRPLGKLGRIGAGAIVIARGSPYAQSDNNPIDIFPAIVYLGNRIQITGPYAQIGILGSGSTRLAGTIGYRQATYEEEDSPVLIGMQDRESTAMAGISLQMDTLAGFNIEASYQWDILDRIGGSEGNLSLSRPIPWKRYRFTPSVSLHFMQSNMANHDYGVSVSEETADRKAFQPGSTITPELGMSVFAEITPRITGALMTAAEWFDSDIRNSPIVDDHYVLKGTAFVVYIF